MAVSWCIGLDWTGLDWTGLDWTELDSIGLEWFGLDNSGVYVVLLLSASIEHLVHTDTRGVSYSSESEVVGRGLR